MNSHQLACLLQCCLLAGPLQAAIDAVTSDGRAVRLLDDGTWEYVDAPPAARGDCLARVTVEPGKLVPFGKWPAAPR